MRAKSAKPSPICYLSPHDTTRLARLAAPLAAAPGPGIDRFFQDFLERWVRAEPEMATSMRLFTGDVQDQLDGQLSDIGAAAHARIASAREGLAAFG